MHSTMLSLLKRTGRAFRLQVEVSSAMIQTEWADLVLDSIQFITSQVKLI